MESDAFDAPDAPDATVTTRGHEYEAASQNGQMMRQLEAESKKNRLRSAGVLKATSGNAAKRLRVRQETRVTRAGKTAEAAVKEIATQELQMEKAQMEEWKQKVMQEVAHELQGMRQAQEEAMEAQRRCFQLELEKVKEELELVESRSSALEKEIKSLRAQKMAQEQRPTQNSPAVKSTATPRSNEPKEIEEISDSQGQANAITTPAPPNSSVKPRVEKRNYASVAVSKPVQKPEQPWTQVSYGNRKPKGSQPIPTVKQDQLGRRILFPRDPGQEKSEADLMLALNEALQKAGEEPCIRFSRVRYAPSGAISALLTEKADAGQLIPRRSNLLIRAVKSVDPAVVGVEVLEHWQRLKVHGMPLNRYLGEGKMELLKREVESATGIQLKTLPRWLISENRLKEQQESSNKQGSAIVITVSSESEAKKLCASGLRFGGVVKVVEKYWESGPSSVCMTCSGIGHERMGKCGDRVPKCVICAGPHKIEDHRCGVTGCNKGRGKICAHVVVKCANCGGGHPANSNRCTSRLKAEADARKKKKLDKGKAKAIETSGSNNEVHDKADSSPDMGMDLEPESWAGNEEESSSDQDEIPEGIDHTKDF